GFLLIFYGKWEPGLARAHFGLGNGGDEDDGFPAADGNCTVCKFGKFAGFDRDRIWSDINRCGLDVHFWLFFFFNVKAGQPYATLAIWVSEKFPEGAIKSLALFARQPQEMIPWLLLRNWFFSGGVRGLR
ncbi:MAG: hypothetical protein N2A42_09620, partial [Luteolibacter sp.]